MNDDGTKSLENALTQHRKLAQKVIAKDHLEFDTLYAYVEENLLGAARLHADAHLAVCEECQAQVDELKEATGFIESYEPAHAETEVPDRVLQAIPEAQHSRGAFAKLSFNKNRLLEKVQGVAKSMGGMVDDLADFVVEALAPDTQFIAQTRGTGATAVTDYQVKYKGYEIIVSTLLEQNVLEIYVRHESKNSEEMKKMNICLVDDSEQVHEPTSTSIFGDSLKLIFTDLDLSEQLYELRFASEPISH